MEDTDNAMAGVESMLMSVPGASTPLGRIAIFGGLGTAIAYFVRPSMSFNEDGSAKPWIIFDSANASATLMPYWAYTLVPAVLMGVCI